jgi:farnesyl-diphosphate farnesyltransferase
MGQGMAEFIDKEVITIEDYNLYCHYVAGLVGIGLTKSFIAYGESKALMGASGNDDHLSNQMGLFLQKTNIIRDYHEDVILEKQKNRDLRVFWPEQVWKLYANKIEDFGQDIPSGVKCLNHLITDALGLVPDVLKYLSMLKDQQVFNFCAIPQVMAIATLTEIYNNENVFKRTVKIRKGMTCSLMLNCKNITQVKQTFRHFANVLEKKVEKSNSTEEVRVKTREAIKTIKGLTQDVAVPTRAVGVSSVVITALAVTLGYVFRNDIRRLFNK